MMVYIQYNFEDTEAGGILIGWENIDNGNVVIDEATVPMKKDIRKRTSFIRKDVGHIDYYKELYCRSEGIYAYYGEWHTHPEDYPFYSGIDLESWKNIAREDSKNKQYHIIIGRKKFTIWEMEKKNFCLG